MPVPAPDFAHLFAPGTSHPCPDGVGLLVRVLPGVPLSLPSGRVIAMEPLGWASAIPLRWHGCSRPRSVLRFRASVPAVARPALVEEPESRIDGRPRIGLASGDELDVQSEPDVEADLVTWLG